VPAEHAGVASAVNNDLVRVAALIVGAVRPAPAGITGDSSSGAARHALPDGRTSRSGHLLGGSIAGRRDDPHNAA